MQNVSAAQDRLHCEQGQDHQRARPQLRVRDRGPGQRSQRNVTDQRNGQAAHRIKWCTGKDSNLRTSLGGTDLQSVGFNHSPTCAKNPGRCGRHLRPADHQCRDAGTAHGKPADQSILLSQHRETKARAQHTAKITTRRKSSEWSGFGKTCCAATESAEPPENRLFVRCYAVVLWSWRRDLNPRPPDYKSGALPTELRQQLGKDAPSRKLIPLIPARCPGQLIKLSQWELLAQARLHRLHRLHRRHRLDRRHRRWPVPPFSNRTSV
jgi:hypothetical protein